MPARDLRDSETQPQGETSLLVTPELQLQRTAVELVLSDFEAAKTARDQRNYGTTSKGITLTFDTWLKELKDLYYGTRIPKTIPWRFSSNRSLMIAMAILEVLHARLFPAVYNEDLTRWRPLLPVTEDRARKLETFMFWWVKVHSKLREFFERWCRYAIGFGSVLSVTSWDIQLLDKGEQSPSQSNVNPDGTVSVVPPQKILDRLEKTRSDVIPLEDVFLQPGASDMQRDTVILRRKYLYRDLEDMERDGKVINISQPTVAGQQPLKDFLPVTGVGEGLSPEQRVEMENIKRRNIPVECLEWYGGIDLDQDTFPEQMRLLIVPQHKVYLGGVAISEMSKRGLRHLDLTMYLPRVDEPQGLVGLGILEQVKELAQEIDAIFNQLTDSNSLSILKPTFYDPSGDLDPASLSLAPNKMIPVSRPRESVYIPENNIDTSRLINAITLVMNFIERLTSAGTVIFGQEPNVSGGSGTATRTEAIVGAANQRHAIPVERLRMGAARILSQHLDLIQVNLPPGMEQRVLGEKGDPLFNPNELSQQSLSGEYDAYLLPDESMGSKEAERQLSQLLYTLLTQNIIVMSDPSKLYKITADLLSAWGKDPTQYLGPAPDLNPARSPEEEHQMITSGNMAQVKPTVLQNPIEHLMAHQRYLASPVFQTLDPQSQQQAGMFLQAHMEQHVQLMQLLVSASQHAKGAQPANAPKSNGAARRAPGTAAPVGAEPGMGSVQSPRAQAGGIQRAGEGQVPA